MDRRTFLLGTAFGLGVLTGRARAELPALALGGLRGSLGGEEIFRSTASSDDQSRNLQDAVDRASADGRPVFLPPGRYLVSNVRLPSRTRLVGVPGETRLVYSGGGHMLYAESGSSIGLEGIVLDGANRALGDDAPGLLHAIGVADLQVDRCEFVGSARNAVALEGCAVGGVLPVST